MFILSTNKSKFIKQLYNMCLQKLPSQHREGKTQTDLLSFRKWDCGVAILLSRHHHLKYQNNLSL